MALTAEQRFDVLCPDYKAHPDKLVYLEMADERTSTVRASGWSEGKRAQAVALRAAHMMTLALDPMRAGGSAGPITGKSEGKLSVQFGTSVASQQKGMDDLDQTSFGLQLRGLIRGTFLFLDTTEPWSDPG